MYLWRDPGHLRVRTERARPGLEHYEYKLAWLASLRDMVAAGPEATIVCGDMNIAPTDDDVRSGRLHRPDHVTPPERAAPRSYKRSACVTSCAICWPKRIFTYWDYRAACPFSDLGMRIDLVLASATVQTASGRRSTGRPARAAGRAHACARIVDLDEAPDGEIGPVVPPPSAPAARRGSAKLPQSP